jgi:hypothetical protein
VHTGLLMYNSSRLTLFRLSSFGLEFAVAAVQLVFPPVSYLRLSCGCVPDKCVKCLNEISALGAKEQRYQQSDDTQ